MTKQEAIKLSESGWWNDLSAREVALFQMKVKLLCMPFSDFHKALEKALGRGVFTHELGMNWDGIYKELLGGNPPPTLDEIMDLIPESKRVVILAKDVR